MARIITKAELEDRDRETLLASPVARAFVRTVVARRGITEAQARQIYLDYLDRVPPGADAPGVPDRAKI
jgi:hypothetical protein